MMPADLFDAADGTEILRVTVAFVFCIDVAGEAVLNEHAQRIGIVDAAVLEVFFHLPDLSVQVADIRDHVFQFFRIIIGIRADTVRGCLVFILQIYLISEKPCWTTLTKTVFAHQTLSESWYCLTLWGISIFC